MIYKHRVCNQQTKGPLLYRRLTFNFTGARRLRQLVCHLKHCCERATVTWHQAADYWPLSMVNPAGRHFRHQQSACRRNRPAASSFTVVSETQSAREPQIGAPMRQRLINSSSARTADFWFTTLPRRVSKLKHRWNCCGIIRSRRSTRCSWSGC